MTAGSHADTRRSPVRAAQRFTQAVPIVCHPRGDVELGAFTHYLVEVSDPQESQSAAGLLFSVSSADTTSTGWLMGPTLGGSPIGEGNGEFLKLAVDATAVPEPSSVHLTLFSIAVLILGRLVALH